MPDTEWSTNGQGWFVRTVRGVFIALMREHERSWRWVGFANGRPLGHFNGLALAKRDAIKRAQELR